MENEPKYIIFTDLDGTLLDSENYSAAAASKALDFIRQNNIPLIFVTSKTAMEICRIRAKLKNVHPFVCENGGGIYIPKGYFEGNPADDEFEIIGLGVEYSILKRELKEASNKLKIELQGMSQLSDREIIKLTGIKEEDVPHARQRGFDEPFVIKSTDPNGDAERLIEYFNHRGLNVVRGNRFYHLTGGCDKGMAIQVLLGRFEEALGGGWKSVGFGDSPNDIPLFEAVEIPIAVKKPPKPGHFDFDIRDVQGLNFADGIGPAGWNKAALELLQKNKLPV
ncbi:MAG: HAD-IIB family hydrolase [candidate division Zixibacteria bacterium]|nr:HAD-IIB family hydrolase [candidate division Zixibacteria bacterium]